MDRCRGRIDPYYRGLTKTLKNSVHSVLEADHRELDAVLRSVFEALDSGDITDAYGKLDLFWARLAVHIRAEHLVVFPAVRKRADLPETEDILARLRSDHDMFMTTLARAVKALRAGSDGKNDGAAIRLLLEGVRWRLSGHNDLEENEVYARIAELGPAEVRKLHDGVLKELGNMPPRFRER